jgi:hypothetical protein
MRRIKSLLLAVFVVVGLFFSPVSCGVYSDACDEARDECRDSGGSPINCEEDYSGCTQKCVCECIMP